MRRKLPLEASNPFGAVSHQVGHDGRARTVVTRVHGSERNRAYYREVNGQVERLTDEELIARIAEHLRRTGGTAVEMLCAVERLAGADARHPKVEALRCSIEAERLARIAKRAPDPRARLGPRSRFARRCAVLGLSELRDDLARARVGWRNERARRRLFRQTRKRIS